MKFQYFLKDKKFFIISFLILWFLILLLLFAYKVSVELIIALSLLLFIFAILVILIEYFKKKKFYNALITITANLDKKYLVTEMLTTPDFLEGKILYNTLYEIDKSMLEHIKTYEENIQDFKEYIEMWIHEVKIPLSSLVLMVHNNQKLLSGKITKTIQRLDNYVEQVLFYVRAENAEKDYLIKKSELNKIISKIALKNKDYLLESNIDFIVEDCHKEILTDAKWLEFILDQIINNSIKYKRNINNSFIKIYTEDNKKELKLIIEDNGIGINNSDLPRVFEKTFTGTNGRIKSKSTGMGLYIAKSLCEKLGHKITIVSQINKYTRVMITFNKENLYDVLN